MKVTSNSVVELIYELIVDGQLVDHTTKEKPLGFIFGTGSLLPKFESNIENLEPGGKFSFTLTPEEGYGEVDPERIIDLPIEIFVDRDGNKMEELLKVGAMVPLVNGMGQVVPGKVLEVAEKTVRMDLNSPMAGKTLNFSGEIISVREATEKELNEGLHGEFVHSNCKGGCGHHNCKGGECGHGECGHGECGKESCDCNCN